MTTEIIEFNKPKLKSPIFIEGLPGVGNIGRIAAGYLIEELGAKKFAELHSSYFMPLVLLHPSSLVHVLKNEFYYWKSKKKNQRDLIILIGDSQSINPEGHYEIVENILKYIKKFDVKMMFTLAGLSVTEPKHKVPYVLGTTNSVKLVKKYKKYGIDFKISSHVGTISGAAGLLLGRGMYHKIDGICLLGESIGFPMIADPKSSEEILKVLIKILNLNVKTKKLDKKIREMEEFIQKIQNIEKQTIPQTISQQPSKISDEKERLTYIG